MTSGHDLPSRHPAQRSGAPLRPRRALILLGSLGAGFAVGRIVDILDHAQPILYGAASWLSACGLIRTETEADPIG